MAKISTYPIVSVPDFSDLLIGTDVENLNETKNFTIGDIADLIIVGSYVPYTGAINDVDLGTHSITASSFIVPGGLASQFVKADGSLDSTVYQPSGNYMTGLSGEATASGPGVSAVVLNNGAVVGKVLTGLTVTGGSISSSDSILQAFGKLQNQVNSLYGGAIYQGTWNALTNNPLIQSGVGTKGYYYVVNVAGTTNIDGITDWHVGDWIIFDGTAWQQVDNTDTVVSVNGKVGVVVLTTTDIAEGTNLYYTDVRARGALLLTTVGNSGASTYNTLTGTFNIPNYTLSGLGGVPSSRLLTINGTQYDLSADRSWSVGTVTSIGTSGPLTGGTITGSGTIGITQSGVSTDGYLSSTDWNTFNNKQNALTNPVTGTGTVYYLPMWSGLTTLTDSIISYTANVINYNYNSASGATVNYININGTPYTYTIQMNNVGTRQTYHSYTDGNIIQRIGVNDVSRNLSTGQLVLPSYTTLTSFTGTTVGYIGFDASGNILTVPVPTAGITGSGVAGQVTYWNGTSTVTGSNNFFWDAVNNRLGIGTNTPSYGLHNVGSSAFDAGLSGDAINILNDGFLKWSSVRFRGFGASFLFQDNAFGIKVSLSMSGSASYFNTGGNYLFGTTTDSGQRLQVQGTSLFNGYALFGSGNSGTPLATLADFRGGSDVDFIQVARVSTSSDRYVRVYANGQIDALSTKTDSAPFTFAAAANANTTGNRGLFTLTNTFNPTSGTATYTTFAINQTINQTGGANGITRGLYVNPTLTAASDWRSIEWSNNSGWGLYGAGTANNYLGGRLGIGTTTPSYSLDLWGASTATAIARVRNFSSGNASLLLDAADNNAVSIIGFLRNSQPSNTYEIRGYHNQPAFGGLANAISFYQPGSTSHALVITEARNILVNTTSDAGFRLDVNGTARVTGLIRGDANLQLTGTFPFLQLTPSGTFGNAYLQAGLNLAGTAVGDYTTFLNPTGKGFTFYSGSVLAMLVEATTQNIVLNGVGSSGYRLYINRGGSATGAMAVVGGITDFAASTTSYASLQINPGVAPTSPVNGNIWSTTTDLLARINGTTYSLINSGLSGSGAAGQVTYWDSATNITGSNNLTYTNPYINILYTGGAPGQNTLVGGINFGNQDYIEQTFTYTATQSNLIFQKKLSGVKNTWLVNDFSGNTAIGISNKTLTVFGDNTKFRRVNIVGGISAVLNITLGGGDNTPVIISAEKDYYAYNHSLILNATNAGVVNTNQLVLSTVGNVLINSGTDSGQRLQVQGTTLLNGAVTIDAGASNDAITILNSGFIKMNSTRLRASGVSFQFQNDTYNDKVVLNTAGGFSFFVNGGGNYGFGTSTDLGTARLQVDGNAFIKGSGATSATSALSIQDSAGVQLFRVRNDNKVIVSNLLFGTDAPDIFPTATGAFDNNGGSLTIRASQTNYGVASYNIYFNHVYAGRVNTSGTSGGILQTLGFSPTSGTGIFNQFTLAGTINQTGGANGLTRAIFISPILTSAYDWRSIEWQNNTGWGLYGVGTAPNLLNGSLGIGSTGLTNANLAIAKNISGSTSAYGVLLDSVIQSGVTANAYGFRSLLTTQAAVFTLTSLVHFTASQTTQGAGSIILNQVGFDCGDMNNAYTNIAYRGQISQGTLQWNLYMSGTASNYLAAQLLIGTTTKGTFLLDVNGTARVSGASTFGGTMTISSGISITYTDNILIASSAAFPRITLGGSSTQPGAISIGKNSSATNNQSMAIGGGASCSGAYAVAIGYAANSTGIGSITLGYEAVGLANSFVAGSGYSADSQITNVYFGSGVRHQTGNGVNYTINGSGAAAAFNLNGGNLTIAGGKGSGSGTAGDVIISTATVLGSGITLQSLTDRVWIKGDTGNLLIGSATDLGDGAKLQVNGAGRINHLYAHTTGVYTSGLFSFTSVTTATSPSYTSGMFYGAGQSYYRNEFQGSATIPNSVIQSAQFNGTQIRFVNSSTAITMTQGVSSGIRAYASEILQFSFDNAQTACSVSHVAGMQILAPYYQGANNPTITNFYGIVLNDSTEYSGTLSITNRWGIYQSGASDNNYFKGKVIIGSTDTVGVSPLNVKNLPTSSAGLATGDVWNDSGTLKIA